ncbi:hypothetical protein N657DRAFT_677791 [Parathielavia appendiculata]|uniref:Uncharacterized protein n=1 Tax=Parathielavia appendiculata TaxID=2587402 RepID=A0AAN6U6F1_9PEZI|nr:hypothetical protein N657DRAFT_677791 [Parathielavia appendiculata]
MFRTVALASPLNTANHRGETFLHILDPTSLPCGQLAPYHTAPAGKGFVLTQLDETGQTFMSGLMLSLSSTLESLEAVFPDLPEPDHLALVLSDPHSCQSWTIFAPGSLRIIPAQQSPLRSTARTLRPASSSSGGDISVLIEMSSG